MDVLNRIDIEIKLVNDEKLKGVQENQKRMDFLKKLIEKASQSSVNITLACQAGNKQIKVFQNGDIATFEEGYKKVIGPNILAKGESYNIESNILKIVLDDALKNKVRIEVEKD